MDFTDLVAGAGDPNAVGFLCAHLSLTYRNGRTLT